jgi:mercuric reductase
MTRELVILGYGAAGFAALIAANELGIKPTVIGYGPLGGTCVNVGCVPSKRALRLAELRHHCEGNSGGLIDYCDVFKDVQEVMNRMRKEKYEDVLSYYDVELIEGKAHFVSPNAVKVNGKVIEGKKFIIATGSSPSVPNIPGLKSYWTNVEALNPPRKISSLVIIGGRALALEFAQLYRRLGVEVALLQRSKTLIPDWEPEVALEAQRILEDEGVLVATNVAVREVREVEGRKLVVTNKGEVEADEILLATGRKPNVDIGLEDAGIELNERGGIKVNDELRTTNPNAFAAGDVIGGPMLEALAGYEGTIAVRNAVRNEHRKVRLDAVPQVIFTQPAIARVGLTQAESGGESRVVRMRDVPKAQILGETRGLIKMVADRNTKRILGVQMVGERAEEVINEAALAIRHNLTIDDVIDTVHVFPTMSEALRLAALAFYKDVSKLSCCT